jgi:hypothetical protein
LKRDFEKCNVKCSPQDCKSSGAGGASLKDLGKKWFAFSKLNEFLPDVMGRLLVK